MLTAILNIINYINFQRLVSWIILFVNFVGYTNLPISKKLINLNCLTYYYHSAVDLLYLLLLTILLDIISFINIQYSNLSILLIVSLLESTHLLTTTKLMNLVSLTYCHRCIIDPLCLLLLTTFLDIINFIDFKYFDSSILLIVSLSKYINLPIIKRLINLDHPICCCCYAIDTIFYLISCNFHLPHLIVAIYLILLLSFTLSCYYHLYHWYI